MRRAVGAWLLLAAIMMACAEVAPPPPESVSQASPAGPLPTPGRPYEAAGILDAMRESRRPGGVPDQLESDELAGAIADRLYTIDGQAWDAMTVGGSCGPASCTLDVVGIRDGMEGEDVWTFGIDPDTGTTEVLSASLGVLPDGMRRMLDEAARRGLPIIGLDGLTLAGARWTPPPDEPALVLSYRTGNEEGSCEVDVTLDAETGRVTSHEVSDC